MHENFMISDDIRDITQYIIYFTQEKLYELKDISPKTDIDDISIKFSSRYGRILGTYNPQTRVFVHNLNWINEHMDHPDFKTELDNHIIHEVAHVAYPDHSIYWKSVCRQLGHPHPDRVYNNETFQGKPKYILRCPICGQEYNMYGKPRRDSYCSKCYRTHKADALLVSEKQYRMIKARQIKNIKRNTTKKKKF